MKPVSQSKEPKFIYWFAFYSTLSPSVRYRGKYPLDHLKSQYNVGSYFVIPGYHPKRIIQFAKAYCSALFLPKPGSLIVIQRVHSNFIYSRLLKLLILTGSTPVVYDLDDADYLEYPAKSLFWFIKNCSKVIVGSHELAENLKWLNPNVVINTSPTPELGVVKSRKNHICNIGWIGCFGGGHKQSLVSQFFPALKDLPFPTKLTILGVTKTSERTFLQHYFKDFNKILLDIPAAIEWENELSVQTHISNFDIGIATLLDDELHRCKSAFKTKQYLNCGVPVLSSDIPENNRFVKNGVNGFLCSSTEDFRKGIEKFEAMKPNEYSRMSKAAHSSVADFDIPNYCQTLLSTCNPPVLQT